MSFVLNDYDYNQSDQVATFRYSNNGFNFTERLRFETVLPNYDQNTLDRALFMAFVFIGVSYFKTFPTADVRFESHVITSDQAKFFNSVYQEGLSQFAFENSLARSDLACFVETSEAATPPSHIQAVDNVPLVLQSGGKDSLLLSSILTDNQREFTPWFMTTATTHPSVLDSFDQPLHTVHRTIDTVNLQAAAASGALDGHVPITYIVLAISVIQAILLGKDTVLMAVGHEGEEPYAHIGDLAVMHQWAKTWQSEESLAQYVQKFVSSNFKLGSPLRRYSELKIAQLFVVNAWQTYSRTFSSCNIGNYKQGQDNAVLGWCGNCPKCANSFLLFAPFVEPAELTAVFNGENLFAKAPLTETFKGILGVDGVSKPFECIGEEAELRKAYHLAHSNSAQYTLPFDVPDSDFDKDVEYPYQSWTAQYI